MSRDLRKRRGARSFGRLARWTAATVSLLLALAFGELLVRVFDLAPAVKSLAVSEEDSVYRRSTNPVLGYELKAGHRDPDADLAASYPSTNSHGQRDIERSLHKPAAIRRILLLGDSVVEGHKIADLDDTMSRQLESLYPPGSTEVLNFGVSGYCTLAEIELLEVKGLAFDPDVVVVIFVANDFDNFNREAFQLAGRARRPKAVEALFHGSHLFRLLCIGLDLFDFAPEIDPVAWNDSAIGDNNVVEGLTRLATLAGRYGFEAVVAVWPVFEDDTIADAHPLPGHADELIVERLARSRGIEVFRLSEAFRQHRAGSTDPVNPRLRYTIGDRLHPSVEGNRIAARELHRILEDPARRKLRPADPATATDPGAIAAARALGTERPDYARTINNIGLRLKEAGRVAEAIDEFRSALEIDPDLADAHNNLGNALRQLGNPAEAIEHYRLAVEASEFLADAPFNLGALLELEGREEESIAWYERALAIDPDFVQARLALGHVLARRGLADAAIVQFRLVVERDPGNAAALVTLGSLLASRADFGGAISSFRRALERNPDHALAHRNLGQALAAQGEFDASLIHLERAVALDPSSTAGRDALRRVRELVASRR